MGKRRTTGLDAASGEDRLALEHDSILIISLVRDGAGACLDVVIEFANDAWRDDFGISERDLAGHSLFATVPALKQRLPVVYMSGYSAEAIFDGGVLERDVAYLAKPFTADALKRMIREVLDQAGTSAG